MRHPIQERRVDNAKLGLATMIDRSVNLKTHRHTQSLTRAQISTLKMVSSESRAKPIGSQIGTIIRNVFHYCSVSNSGAMNGTCENYGHRLGPGPRGKDDHYHCADCKKVINGPADLRKATPTRTEEVCDGSWRSNSRTGR